MTPNETRTLWISVFAALVAAILIYQYMQEVKREYDRKFGSTKVVVVASKDIFDMQTIDDTMLETVERPAEFIEPDAVTDPKEIIGQVAAAPIKRGEQILFTKLLKPGPATGISLQVAPNKRAFTLPIDDIRGVARLIRPGDRIDIMAAIDVGRGQNARREVHLLLQDVPVLATGVRVVNNIPRIFQIQQGDAFYENIREDTQFTNITIEASPREAQDLTYILATAPGNIFVTLRNPNDRNIIRQSATTENTVIGQGQQPAASAPPRRPANNPPPQAAPPAPAPTPEPQQGRFRTL